MGFWNTLGEASATLEGNEEAAKRFYDQGRGKEQQKKDFELQTQTEQILGDVQTLNDRRAKLDPNSPTYQKDLTTIDQALHDARQVFTDLYHPAKNPGALSKLHGFIQSHIGRHKGKTAAAPATPAAAKQSINERMAGIEATAYGQSTPENPYTKQRRELKEAMPNISEEDLDKATRIGAKVEAPPRTPTSSWKMYMSPDGKDRQYFDVTDKESIPPGWMAVSSKAAQGNAPKVGSFGDFMIQGYGEHPTAQDYEEGRKLWAEAAASTTEGEHIAFVQQKDGTILPITILTTSKKTFTGAPGTPNPQRPTGTAEPTIPKTPADAKSRITPPGPGGPGPHASARISGPAVGGRLTAPQVEAQKKFQAASGLAKLADEVSKHPDDAINQKRLAVRLERISAGRFTTQALQYIIKAGWGNTVEQWANNVTTGALPPDVLRQLVDGAHQEVTEAREEMRTSGLEVEQTPEEKILQQLNEAFGPKKQPEKKK